MTVLLTTHYMEEADELCDRVGIMHRGLLRVLGPPKDLREAMGPDATLEDVFRAQAGDIEEGRRAAPCPRYPPNAQPTGLTAEDRSAPCRLLWRRTSALCLAELWRIRHDRTELYMRAIQPALWLLIFGETFTKIHVIPTGNVPYLDYLAPGIMAQSALFISIFYGIQIIWDRDAGILTKLMTTPTPRAALVTGKAFAAGVRSMAQVFVVLVLSTILGVTFDWNVAHIALAVLAVVLGSAFFTTLSVSIAGLVLTRDRLMGIGQAITMPLFFASNALYPVALMPGWAGRSALINPLSYEVERPAAAAASGCRGNLWLDFGVLTFAAVLGVTVAVVAPRPAGPLTVRRVQTLRASHSRGSSISGSDGIASGESHMVASVASSVSSTTVSQNAPPCTYCSRFISMPRSRSNTGSPASPSR